MLPPTSETDIVRLADEDNENDEYHTGVSAVDVWAHYAYLESLGWKQKEIAEAKGVSQQLVSQRIRLNSLPEQVKDFTTQGLLDEGHLREILSLQLELYFIPWLTSEQAWIELAEKAVYDKGKNGNKTVKAVKADVDTWRAFIAEAEGVGQALVSKRLKLSRLPVKIKDFIHQEFLLEAHLIEISQLFINEYFSPWLLQKPALDSSYFN